jgi:hypothetical protein
MIIRHGVKKFYKRENNIRAKDSGLVVPILFPIRIMDV